MAVSQNIESCLCRQHLRSSYTLLEHSKRAYGAQKCCLSRQLISHDTQPVQESVKVLNVNLML